MDDARWTNRLTMLLIALAGTLMFSGCGALKSELADSNAALQQTQDQRDALQKKLQQCQGNVDSLQQNKASLEKTLAQKQKDLNGCQAGIHDLKETSKLQGKKLEQRLAELRQLREKANRNQRLYKDLMSRLRSMIEAGQLEVTNENGRLVINLPQDILFGSGSSKLGDEGVSAISQVGKVLSTIPDRRFQVEGFTDNVPINTRRFPSNWELSAARALAVVKILINAGVDPNQLSGAGYGKYSPRVPNDTPEHRAENRRIEIVLVPQFDFDLSDN